MDDRGANSSPELKKIRPRLLPPSLPDIAHDMIPLLFSSPPSHRFPSLPEAILFLPFPLLFLFFSRTIFPPSFWAAGKVG